MLKLFYGAAEVLARRIGLKASHLFPSPSKFFLLRKLVNCLDRSEGMSVGIDAACADFKYRDLFKTAHYVGLDLDPSNLHAGLEYRARALDVGVLANILDLKRTPDVGDVVVSTHTIASLPNDLQIQGVKVLAESVTANGTLFFNMPAQSDSDEVQGFLQEHFGQVERIVYGAPMFKRIENFFAYRTASKNPAILALLGVAIVISYFLSFLEELEWVRRRGDSVLYRCRNRKSRNVDARLTQIKALSLDE